MWRFAQMTNARIDNTTKFNSIDVKRVMIYETENSISHSATVNAKERYAGL